MKIRTDFVTNSSSASFTAYQVDSKLLADFLRKLIDEGKATHIMNGYDLWSGEACEYLDVHDDYIYMQVQTLNYCPDVTIYGCLYQEGNEIGTGYYDFGKQRHDSKVMNNLNVISDAVSGFFTEDIVNEVKRIIRQDNAEVESSVYNDYTDGCSGGLNGVNVCRRFGDVDLFEGRLNSYSLPIGDELVIPDSTEVIGISVFAEKNMKRVRFSNGLRIIMSRGFYRCQNLEEVVFPDSVYRIGDIAFCMCTSLKKVVLPKKLKIIETSAFEKCTSLTEIVLPESVTRINKDAFRDCRNLEKVTVLGKLEQVHPSAFTNCKKLADVPHA